jgi:hypothetical protein
LSNEKSMDKNELTLEVKKVEAWTHRWGIVGDLLKVLFTVAAFLVAIYLIMKGLPAIFTNHKADDINAMAKVFSAMHFGCWSGWLGGGVMTGAWSMEKSRRKRAESKLSQ